MQKNKLSKLQYLVTQKEHTECAFDNEYWDNKEKGIYLDIVTNKPLFLSINKYDSGTGWPSFTEPIDINDVETKDDYKMGYKRIEIHSQDAKTHLGHVFDDGSNKKKRYCINSASMKFVPLKDFKKYNLEKYLKFFN